MGSDQSKSVESDLLSPVRQESVSSEKDLPYVPYTVNRPIGTHSGVSRFGSESKRGFLARKSQASRDSDRFFPSGQGTLVTVKKGQMNEFLDPDIDTEIKSLNEVPYFLPIMRASLSGVTYKDPDILERLDYRGLFAMCERYSDHLKSSAEVVCSEQAEVFRRIREVDSLSSAVFNHMNEKRKQYEEYSDKLSKVTDMSRVVSRCHDLLNENIEKMEILNDLLPPEKRLEPFVWTTG